MNESFIPENAFDIQIECLWCGWSRPVSREDQVSHMCPQLWWPESIERAPVMRLTYWASTPVELNP